MIPWDILEKELESPIQHKSSVGGGSINQSYRILLENKKELFVKFHPKSPPNIFAVEAKGLKAIAEKNCIRVPNLIAKGENFLALEWINSTSPKEDFYPRMGRALAQLHKKSLKDRSYGWDWDNYIGSLPQSNTIHKTWSEFWMEERIKPQQRLAENLLSNSDMQAFKKLEEKIESILGESKMDLPSPIHGDLWGGNHLCDENNDPVLIDPAFYYGHREADLAMTAMFASYPKDFYGAYEEEYPLKPGFWEERIHLYLLYHQLSHLNHFGASYLDGVKTSLGKLNLN